MYLKEVFLDIFFGAGFYVRRDYFKYTNIKSNITLDGRTSGFTEADEAYKAYPLFNLGTKIGFRNFAGLKK